VKALIGLHEEMEQKFVKNAKKQSKIFSLYNVFQLMFI